MVRRMNDVGDILVLALGIEVLVAWTYDFMTIVSVYSIPLAANRVLYSSLHGQAWYHATIVIK